MWIPNNEDEEIQIEEVYIDPDTKQIIIYDTDGNQHVLEEGMHAHC